MQVEIAASRLRRGQGMRSLAAEHHVAIILVHHLRKQDSDDLTTAEREELNRLRRENRQLKMEREILSNERGPGPPVA